ncbi:MAG: glycerophosphodiester phosphodiesterase [Saprospirales bacterium]|nr:MAG: glycerophosphodiester phosphodiesterase [Saprospirales bacterium]
MKSNSTPLLRYLSIILLSLLFLFSSCGSKGDGNRNPQGSSDSPVNQSDVLINNHYYSINSIYDFFNLDKIRPYLISAHRGSRYYSGWPENCLESFEFIMSELPAIIEFDIRMSKDSVLFLLHDESLDRTTNGTGKADRYPIDEILKLRLKDADGKLTYFSPPLLRDVLKWGKDKTILKLDIKRNVPFQMVIDLVRETQSENHVIILVYSIDAARFINRRAPELMISLPIRNEKELDRFIASGLPANRILAFTGTRRTDQIVFDRLNKMGIPSIQGTIGNLDRQAMTKGFDNILDIYNQGASMIATDYPIELYEYLFSQSLIKN